MQATVSQLADLVHGTVLGNGDLVIQSADSLEEAQPGAITFVEKDQYLHRLHQSQASAAIVPVNTPLNGKPLICVPDPLMAFVVVVQHLRGIQPVQPAGIHPRALVHPSASLGQDASILPLASVGENTVIGQRCRLHTGVVVGNHCRLGDDVVLHPNVVLYDHVEVGDRVVIHANAVIGADGFGYRFQQGRHVKIPHLGGVIIGSDVEIGACATVDRGVFSLTRIGDGTKIDNLVHIAHNCQIGKHNLLAGLTGIAGSVTTGEYVTMAGQVGVADHVHIEDRVAVGGKSGISRNVASGERMFGIPARPIGIQSRIHATLEKLPEMRRDLQLIKKRLGMKPDSAGNSAS